jgi:excisionase family DNA binding protein
MDVVNFPTESRVPFRERISCTVSDACKATGLGPTKLYELINDGRVVATKVDGRRLISVASLRKLIPEPTAT